MRQQDSDNRLRFIFGFIYTMTCVFVLFGVVFLFVSGKANHIGQSLFFTVSEPVRTTDETEKAEMQASEAVLTDVLSDEQLVDSFSQNEQTRKPLQYVTPRDVTAMQADYLAVFADKETDGKVLEDDFSRSGVTDWAQNAAVRNATASKSPDFEQLLSEGMQLEKFNESEPLVLIYHTHTSESYLLADNGVFWNAYQTHSQEEDRNMVRIGEEIADVLESAGIRTVHDKTVYDTQYNGAYARSREGIIELLEQYPSVQIVLDVHRDAFYYSDTSRGKPVAEINGKKAAQIMIISGAEEGQITDFPDWEYNLRFALELQNTASTLYDGLMRPIYFCQRKYNMDIIKNALLLEIGSDANTLDEALYAANLCAQAMVKMIEKHK